MSLGNKITIEIFGDIEWDTTDAVLFSDRVSKCWLPKSQIEVRELANGVEIDLPYWLALEKGLV